MAWTCSACSYAENDAARSRCALCDAQKPSGAAAAAAAPKPAGPQWACRGCTYVNASSDAKCIMCAYDRPAGFAAARAAPPAQTIRAPAAGAGRAAPAAAANPRPSPTPSPPAAAVAAARAPAPTNGVASASGSARPAVAAAAPAPSSASSVVSESDVASLMLMGFTRPKCVLALQTCKNSKDTALDWLLAQASPSPPPAAAAAAAPAKPAAASSTAKPAVAKPAVAAPAASTKPTTAAASSSATKATPAAAAAVAPLPKRTPAEQQAFEKREAKRLELLRLLDEEEQAKLAKAKAKQEAAATAAQAAVKKPAASSAASSSSASFVSASSLPPPPSTPAAATPASLTADQIKLQKIQEERQLEADKLALNALRTQKRLEAEAKIRSIPATLSALRSNYDALRFTAIITLLRKILDKIVADQGRTEKFRRIALDNPKIEQNLLRPIGAIWILKQAGFVETIATPAAATASRSRADEAAPMDMSDSNSPSPPAASSASSLDGPVVEQRVLYMDASRVNLPALASLSQTLAQQLAAQSSSIPRIFAELMASGRYGTEALYLLALELRDIVHNIIVSTDEAEADERREASMSDVGSSSSSSSSGASSSLSSRHKNRNFLTIDKHENAYKTRIKPIVESKLILAELGFQLDPHDVARQYLIVPYDRISADGSMSRYQVMLRELHVLIRDLQPVTPIALSLQRLCAQNRQKPMATFVSLFLAALRLVVANPHEQKFMKLVLSKLQAKIGSNPSSIIHGMSQFVQLFDFKPVPLAEGADEEEHAQAGRVALTYPGYDVELLSLRADQLERSWQALLEKAAAEPGAQATSWSFA